MESVELTDEDLDGFVEKIPLDAFEATVDAKDAVEFVLDLVGRVFEVGFGSGFAVVSDLARAFS